MNEFVEHNVNGFIIDVEKYLGRCDGFYWAESICSIPSLTETMQKYVDYPDLIKTQSLNARNYAEKFLDWNQNGKILFAIIEQTMNTKIDKSAITSQVIEFENTGIRKFNTLYIKYYRIIKFFNFLLINNNAPLIF